MPTIRIKLKGSPRLARWLSRGAARVVDLGVGKLIRETTGHVKSEGREKVPVLTGALRQSIHRRASRKRGYVAWGLPYGFYVEHGVSSKAARAARPHILPAAAPAFESLSRKIDRLMIAAIAPP